MSLILSRPLASLDTLRDSGVEIVVADESVSRAGAIRVGLANLMPDAAIEATERQFLGLVSLAAEECMVAVDLIHVPGVPRSAEAAAHLVRHYVPIERIDHDLDRLIITGTAPRRQDLETEDFWPALTALLDWAERSVGSTFCSCLAAHAALLHFYGIQRIPLARKRWGVFGHSVVDITSALSAAVPSELSIPHSRYFGIGREALARSGLKLVIDSEAAGPHLFTSADGASLVLSQGHLEYGAHTLLREFIRDVDRARERGGDMPHPPVNYFSDETSRRLEALRGAGRCCGDDLAFLWKDAVANKAPWRGVAVQFFRNWLFDAAPIRSAQTLEERLWSTRSVRRLSGPQGLSAPFTGHSPGRPATSSG